MPPALGPAFLGDVHHCKSVCLLSVICDVVAPYTEPQTVELFGNILHHVIAYITTPEVCNKILKKIKGVSY